MKGFVGAGVIRSRFRQTVPYWKEELAENRVIWPYRFEFDVTHLVPVGNWGSAAVSNGPYGLANLAGLNPVRDLGKALEVVDGLKFTVIRPVGPAKEIAAMVFEMGKIQRMFVEADYPLDTELLDVIWKRTIRSVPTFAFAIHLKGDFNQPLKILKHAHDVWNSRPFLVTDPNRISEVTEIASGLYHEFTPELKIPTTTQVRELYDSNRRYYDLTEKYGLR